METMESATPIQFTFESRSLKMSAAAKTELATIPVAFIPKITELSKTS